MKRMIVEPAQRGERQNMKYAVLLIALLGCFALALVGNASLTSASQDQIPAQSKDQPKKVKLDTDSVDDKWGEVAFDHTNHTTKNYSIDGKSLITCVECHHTDQPKPILRRHRL